MHSQGGENATAFLGRERSAAGHVTVQLQSVQGSLGVWWLNYPSQLIPPALVVVLVLVVVLAVLMVVVLFSLSLLGVAAVVKGRCRCRCRLL